MNTKRIFSSLVIALTALLLLTATAAQAQTSCLASAQFYRHRADAWYAKDEFDRAIADYDRALTFDPREAVAYHHRGLTWAAKGDLGLAIADYNRAIKLNPRYALAYASRGVARLQQGKEAEAARNFEAWLNLGANLRPLIAASIEQIKRRAAVQP